MTRQEKYPDTNTFHFYNANPKGKYTTDCVIRAISTATQIPYKDVLKGLYDVAIKTGYHIDDKKCYERYLNQLGWVKCKQPRNYDGTKYTGKQFCRKLLNYDCDFGDGNDFNIRRIIANIGGHHIVAIVEGQVYDIWDSTDGCIGNYWVKE